MTTQRNTKLKWLEHNLPEGLVADASWLTRHGYSTSLRSQYVAAGWLEQPARGVYRRPGGPLSWEQVVISLQMLLKRHLIVGGRTALELQGYGHYFRQSADEVHLYGPEHPPAGWRNFGTTRPSSTTIAGDCSPTNPPRPQVPIPTAFPARTEATDLPPFPTDLRYSVGGIGTGHCALFAGTGHPRIVG